MTTSPRMGTADPVVSDPFMASYLAGTPRAVSAPATRPAAHRAELLSPEPIGLGGQLVTSEGALRAWLVIQDGQITDIVSRKPDLARTVATEGVIVPGLIDLHGHPEFNIYAPWEPPRTYVNRYSWRDSDEYQALIREPQNRLKTQLPAGTQLRYAEIRALVGGVTAIQGAGGTNRATTESLVRNVDLNIFGKHRARTMIDLPSGDTGWGIEDLASIVADIAAGQVDAFYLHLAEGQSTNQRSIDEFDRMVNLDALTAATVIIHGTALTRDQLGQAADAGAKLIWSPQSNLRLYGQTTRAADAIELGLPVALGADWMPSGSTSLLAEMKVARQELATQGRQVAAADLVQMVTADAASIAGLADQLGTLAVGRPADLVVLARRHDDPYESICAAYPIDVELLLIGGDLTYGREDWIQSLAGGPTPLEPVTAWGKHMLLDTTYHAQPDPDTPSPTLAQLRADLTSIYPPVGPIWA